MKFKKRGMSPIIATVLIVLLTITAAAMIAGFLIPFVRENLNEGSACVDYRNYFSFEEGYNCYDGDVYSVSVKAFSVENLSGNVDGFYLTFLKEGSSKKVEATRSSKDENIIVFDNDSFDIPKSGEFMTYNYTDIEGEEYVSVDIYPVLKSGRMCDKSDSIDLRHCRGGTR